MPQGESAQPNRVSAVGVGAAVALYVVLVALVHQHADDGYIALRYVQNLMDGHGLVYNAGERVEGYNCFLWLILVGAVSAVLPAVPMHLVAEGIGIAAGIATLILTAVVAQKRYGLSGWWAVVPALLMAGHSGFIAWTTGGLETTLFAGMILAGAALYLRWLETGRSPLAAPVFMGIATLTRPDAVPVFLAIVSHAAFVTLRQHGLRGALLLCARWGAAYAAVILPWFLWRYNYYGWLLPNTAYAKVGTGMAQYRRGVEYIVDYVRDYQLAFMLLPAVVAFLVRRDQRSWVLAWMLGAHLAFVVVVGGDGLGFERFLVYSAPLMMLLIAGGYERMYRWIASRWRVVAAPATVAAVVLSTGAMARKAVEPVVAPSRVSWTERQSGLTFPLVDGPRPYTWFDNYFVDRQAHAIRILSALSPTGLIATTPAGAVAYFGKFTVIDMLGLNDEHIAHVEVEMGAGRAGHEKGDGAYVLSRKPDAILLGNVAVLTQPLDSALMSKKLVLRSENEIWAMPEFHRDYELVSVPVEASGPFQWFTYARRRDGVFARATSAVRTRENRE
jgi:hypothetical protein